MDPNANLAEQESILTAGLTPSGQLHNYDRYRLYDLRVALRDWFKGEGFAPDWDKYPIATAAYRRWAN